MFTRGGIARLVERANALDLLSRFRYYMGIITMIFSGLFTNQKIMRRVAYSLAPIFLFSIYLYGWRVLSLTAVTFIFGILTEYVVEKGRGKKVSQAVLVTCTLYALSLPPATPHWIAAVGIVFGVFIGKELFGGFGRNIFNPAITGRLFIYICFPTKLSNAWVRPGNFGAFAAENLDTITAATPLAVFRNGGTLPDLLYELFGVSGGETLNLILGLRAGSIGESSIVLILIAAIYLLVTKTAQWRLLISALVAEIVLHTIFYYSGLPTLRPDRALLSGSLIYVAVFMCTDPVTAPNKPLAQLMYGTLIGVIAVTIRSFSGFPEGTSFAVMMGNVFASLLDEISPKAKKKKKKASRTIHSGTPKGGPGRVKVAPN